MDKKKQFGLILKKKTDEPPKKLVMSVFDDDDDETDKVDVSYQKTSASTIREQNKAKRIHDEVLAADPTAFDYDASYEQIQEERDEKIAERKAADKERKSKYAENIMNAHKRRELEKHSREERQQHKEREKEGELYADKEVFITGAYREQQEMVEKFRQEEALEARFDALTSVEKQKVWQAGFARNLLEDLARTGEPAARRKERNLRKRVDSRSPSPEAASSSPGAIEKKSHKKERENEKAKPSIYSDDEDGPRFNPPPKKNFEGELKPGLNKVVKAQTKAERLKERLFTPTPPSSDDETDRKRDNRGNRGQATSSRERREEREAKERQEAEEARRAAKEKEKKNKMKLRIVTAEDKEARLVRLKDILKQRNGPEEIEEFRRRYLERKESGIVVPPL